MRDAQHFVRDFQSFWEAPSAERMGDLLRPDVLLLQPLARPLRGLAAARLEFGRIFRLMPDLRGEVDRWAAAGDALFIELRLSGTVGGSRVEWPVVDRFLLRDGMASERVSYFDPSRLASAFARRPRCWPGLVRSGIWRGWLGGARAGGAQRHLA